MRRAGNEKNKTNEWLNLFQKKKRALKAKRITEAAYWKLIQHKMIKQGEKKGWEAYRRTEQWQMGMFWSVTNVPQKN